MRKNGLATRATYYLIFPIVLLCTVKIYAQPGNSYLKNTWFNSGGKNGLISFLENYTVTEAGLIKIKFPSSANISASKLSLSKTSFYYPQNAKADIGIAYYPPANLILYAKILKQYAIKHGFDTTYVFLCNMGIAANKKRFFVFNMVNMRIEDAGLVSQGRGKSITGFDKEYSNDPGSKCTALGRYKISGKYSGAYGESYKMHGLDSSNKKALARRIVLHSMPCIPDTDAMMPPCASEGCPAVSPLFFSSLQKIIESRNKPLLMWIFDSNLEELVIDEH